MILAIGSIKPEPTGLQPFQSLNLKRDRRVGDQSDSMIRERNLRKMMRLRKNVSSLCLGGQIGCQ